MVPSATSGATINNAKEVAYMVSALAKQFKALQRCSSWLASVADPLFCPLAAFKELFDLTEIPPPAPAPEEQPEEPVVEAVEVVPEPAVQSKKKHRYVTFMIDGGKIKIDKIGERDNNYDQFLEDLMAKDGEADDCRYAIYDYEYVVHSQGTEPSNRSRLFLVSWCPDSARIKKKMVYSASFDSLKKAFTGVQKIIQANGADEVEQSAVEALLKSAART